MDIAYMRLALEEARLAYEADEVPVGAVLVRGTTVIARAHNLCEAQHTPLAHAELLAIQDGIQQLHGYLEDCTLYVTLEPCAMCVGAALNARLSRLVFGAFEPKTGCCGSVADLADHWFLHSIPVIGGVLEQECSHLLTTFFQKKRQ